MNFSTDGSWEAHEVAEFLQAVEDVYSAFVVVSEYTRGMEWFMRAAERRGAVGGQGGELTSVEYVVFAAQHVFELWPESRLTIQRIEMGSPGTISLAGLGEPIHQLREFVKDLWYRNRQEKQAGQLEILRQYLALEREYGPVSPAVLDRLAPKALKGVETLSQLEDRGKLREIPASVGG